MAENEQRVFRKKSLDRVASPEQLDAYVRVVTPGVWMALLAAGVFLAGMLAFGVLGRLETRLAGAAVVEQNRAVLYLPEAAAEQVHPGRTVRLNDAEWTVAETMTAPVEMTGDMDAYLLHAGGFSPGDWACQAMLTGPVESEGIFPAELIADSVSPISFLFN